MQSQQNLFGKDTKLSDVTSRGHQRRQSLGKAMPVTSLLLNFPPLHRSAYYTRAERSPDDEPPPLYFPISASSSPTHIEDTELEESLSSKIVDTNSSEHDHEVDSYLPQDPGIFVSECSSSGSSDNGEDDNHDHNQDVTLVGNSTFYTPCLTCTNNVPDELAIRPNAINEMCRRLCTDECRLRLSLAGFVPPSETALKSYAMLTKHVEIPALPLTRPPPPIDIQRKKFLMDLLTPTDSDNESNFVDDMKNTDSKLVQMVSAVMDRSMDESGQSIIESDDIDDDVSRKSHATNISIDPQEIALLKDFRDKFAIAEALAKTSAMTSTSKIKQRLAARKLEIELDSKSNEKLANELKSGSASSIRDRDLRAADSGAPTAAARHTHTQVNALESMPTSTVGSGMPTMIADKKLQTTRNVYANDDIDIDIDDDDDYDDVDVEVDVDAFASSDDLVKSVGNDFEPPRDLLLYLVRMGSFNSAPKINNVDSQDDGLQIPQGLNTSDLLHHVKLLRGEQYPPLLSRFFFKPLELSTTSLTSQTLDSNDITDGLRYLQLNTVSRGCSAPLSASPNHIRLLQWNILSQTLGQNNDGFVRCPEEALTWENRKFLIVQEILQYNPDIVCLQEVDHFKFLQTILGTQNYEGIFFPKPDSPCLYIEENNGPDGCAIFFKRDKFELKHYETRILEVWRVQSNQVAIAANLRIKAIDREICICTTHLKARQGTLLAKLRNEQGRDLLRFVRNFAGDNRAILLCGDFNAEPVEPIYATVLNYEKLQLSSAYADMRSQEDAIEHASHEIEEKEEDERKVVQVEDDEEQEQEEEKEGEKCAANGTDSSESKDAYDSSNSNNSSDKNPFDGDYLQKSIKNEPPYTTWKIREDGEECHTIDYVFYARDKLKVLNCLEFPHGDEVGKNRTPSHQYPSDHFSLVCDFEILEQNSQGTFTEHESKTKAHDQ